MDQTFPVIKLVSYQEIPSTDLVVVTEVLANEVNRRFTAEMTLEKIEGQELTRHIYLKGFEWRKKEVAPKPGTFSYQMRDWVLTPET